LIKSVSFDLLIAMSLLYNLQTYLHLHDTVKDFEPFSKSWSYQMIS